MTVTGAARRLFGPRVQVWLGVVLGAATLYLAVRGLDLSLVSKALAAVQAVYVLMALLLFLATQLAKAVRWRCLLSSRPLGLSLIEHANLLMIGQTINLLFVTRLGDIARAYLTGLESGASKTYVLGTIAAEKLVDLIALAAVILALIPLVALPAWMVARQGPVVFIAVVLAVATAALLAGRPIWTRWANRAFARLPGPSASQWQARLAAGLDGLGAVADRHAALAVWGWTVVIWSLGALTNLVLFLAFDLPAQLLPAVFLLAVLQAGVAVPSVPGKIGVFHYLCVLALSVFGVPAATALAYGIILHLIVVGSNSLWTAAAMWHRSWNLRQLAVLDA